MKMRTIMTFSETISSPCAHAPHSSDDRGLRAILPPQIAAAVNLTLGGTQFHLIGHDHGGVLGFVAATSADGVRLVKSYTSLSIPHLDAFSAGA